MIRKKPAEQTNVKANTPKMETQDISVMSIAQLKALAFDQIILLEKTKENIRVLQNEIARRGQGE